MFRPGFKKVIIVMAAVLLTVCVISSMAGCSVGSDQGTASQETELPIPSAQTVQPTDLPATEAPATDVPDDFFETREYSFLGQQDRFKISGRTSLEKTGLGCDWSAGGFSVNAYCRGDVVLKTTPQGTCLFTVFIDGVRQEEPVMAKAKTTVAKDLAPGLHTIEVYRRSEVRQSRLVLKSLTVEGELLAPDGPGKYNLVFIGDSITSGYGTNPVRVAGVEDHVDATLAYPFLTARALGADLEVTAVIGIGLVKGYVNETMGGILKYTDYYRSTKTNYSPSRPADLIVINLGTNDATHNSDPAKFKEAARALISDVQSMYGESAPIIWIYNSMRADHSQYTLEVISELKEKGVNITPLKFKADQSAYGHPSARAHEKDTEQLLEFLSAQGIVA